MRHDVKATEREREDAAVREEGLAVKADEIWARLDAANAQEVRDFVRARLGTFPPNAANWTALVQILSFILLMLRVVVRRTLKD